MQKDRGNERTVLSFEWTEPLNLTAAGPEPPAVEASGLGDGEQI
jgi:hypothetical protein